MAALLFAPENFSLGRSWRVNNAHGRLHRMRLEHYRESLGMLQGVAPQHPLVQRLAHELDDRVPVPA